MRTLCRLFRERITFQILLLNIDAHQILHIMLCIYSESVCDFQALNLFSIPLLSSPAKRKWLKVLILNRDSRNSMPPPACYREFIVFNMNNSSTSYVNRIEITKWTMSMFCVWVSSFTVKRLKAVFRGYSGIVIDWDLQVVGDIGQS